MKELQKQLGVQAVYRRQFDPINLKNTRRLKAKKSVSKGEKKKRDVTVFREKVSASPELIRNSHDRVQVPRKPSWASYPTHEYRRRSDQSQNFPDFPFDAQESMRG